MNCFKKTCLRSTNSNNKALLIGINYRQTNSELHGCINDTATIKKLLMKNNYNEKNIKLLTDDSDMLPTKKNILDNLKWLLDNPTNKPINLFFQYSGHGSYKKDNNSDEKDNRDECLVPIDYKKSGIILDDTINDFLKNYMTNNIKLTMLVDACHSGTICDLKYNLNIDSFDKNESNFKFETLNYENINGTIDVFSGCEDHQTSVDAWLKRKSQGAMTYSFTTAINNNNLTYETIMNDLYKIIKKNNFTQNPTLSSNCKIILKSKFIL